MRHTKPLEIKHFAQHRVSIRNIDAHTDNNAEITRLLLGVFQNVYVHDDKLDGPFATIQSVMFQVRAKTHLKILNIHLTKCTKAAEYIFLFGSTHFESMQKTNRFLTQNMQVGDPSFPSPGVKKRLLCVDMHHMNALLLSQPSADTPMPKAYSNILDAMIAGSVGRRANVFDMIIFEIPVVDVKRQKAAIYAQYARACIKFAITRVDRIVNKLYLQIEMKQQNNWIAEYQYGPFPAFEIMSPHSPSPA